MKEGLCSKCNYCTYGGRWGGNKLALLTMQIPRYQWNDGKNK